MGKKPKKGRCVKRNPNVHNEPEEYVNAPHSFVIHKGLSGGHTVQLTKDFRRVMEPFTATNLKERKKNTIKDFVSVAGPLHVSHLSIFSLTELGMYLKILRLPRGPTLTFKIQEYSLSRDVVSSLKRQMVVEKAFKHSPLIVLNSFGGEGLQMKLMASMFQNMFPSINLTNVDLNTIKRCVMLNYNPATKLIDFRHYTIRVAPVGVSKGVKKIVQGKVPDLGKCSDITEYFIRTGVMSESEAEDDPNNHVTLPQKLSSRGNIEANKSAIRLSELGPRLSLQLIKIEDGLMEGDVLYHDLIHKSEEEKFELQKKREIKRKLKDKRKKIQEANKRAKEQAKEEHKQKSLKGIIKINHEPEAIDDDKAYYREEVGEEPDKDLFAAKKYQNSKSGPSGAYHPFKNRKRKFDQQDNGKGGNNKRFKGSNSKMDHRNGRKKGKMDKTNSANRDHRPIGGKVFKVKRKNK